MSKLETLHSADDTGRSCCCNCKRKLDPHQIFEENVEDIAKTLAQIMIVCGISTTKACKAVGIIKRAFVYHEKIRTRCKKTPPEEIHLHRDDLLQALRFKCDMESVESMLTYSIIKRAFKAFFHGKPDRTISNPIVDAIAIHSQRPAWMHAAYKTAKIFDSYQANFFWCHKDYDKHINLLYRGLYERMAARANPLMVPNCSCRNCSKKEVPGQTQPPTKIYEKLKIADSSQLPQECLLCGLQLPKISAKMTPPRRILKGALPLPRCHICNSPQLICECNIDQLTGELYGECGQDSYKVKWYRLEKKPIKQDGEDGDSIYEDAEEPSIDWLNHHCPIDCVHDQQSESSNVCQATESATTTSTYSTCSAPSSLDAVEKLEQYLNKLWAEDVVGKQRNGKSHQRSKDLYRCQPNQEGNESIV